MKYNKHIILISSVIGAFLLCSSIAYAISLLPYQQGGTGLGYPINAFPGAILFENTNTKLATSSSLFWDNTNKRLGIGTTSPQFPLDVQFPNNPYDADYSRMRIGGNASISTYLLGTYFCGGEYVAGNGDLTTIPSYTAPGSACFFVNDQSLGFDDGTIAMGGSDTGNPLNFTPYFYASPNGYFGLGAITSTPSGFNVNGLPTGEVGIATDTPWGLFSINPNGVPGNEPEFVIGSSTKTDFVVTNAGKVGIGTIRPTDVNANAHITIAGTGSQDYIASTTDNTTLSDAIYNAYAPGSRVFMGAHGTNQVSTRYGLTLGGYGEITAMDSTMGTTNGLIIGTNTAKPLIFGTNNAEVGRFLSNGNLGVGTTTAGSPLSVGNSGGINFYPTATSTFSSSANGINITNGCFAINKVCVGSGGGTLTALGTGYATTTGTVVTFSTSTASFNGLTVGDRITATAGALTFQPVWTGTLNNAGLTNSTIGATSPNSTLSFGSAVALGSSFTGDLNLSHANQWIGLQNFVSATSSVFESTSTAYFSTNIGNTLGGVNIGAATTPTSLLAIGTTTSVSAVGGITLGQDSTANLYRSATGVVQTDGVYQTGSTIVGTSALTERTTNTTLSVRGNLSNGTNIYGLTFNNQGNQMTFTSGVGGLGNFTTGFSPISGTGELNLEQLNGTVNQTATAIGITRSLYINPTLTFATNYRALEIAPVTYNTTQATTTIFGSIFNASTAVSTSTRTITNAVNVFIPTPPISGLNMTLSTSTALLIGGNMSTANNATSTVFGGVVTNAYGLEVFAPFGASNNYSGIFMNGNFGIGTTSPYSLLSLAGNGGTANIFTVATSTTGTQVFGIDSDGHRFSSGTAPTISACGTGSGTVVGDDGAGTITTATAATACTATFAKAYKNAPVCTVTDDSLVGFADVSAVSTTAVSFGISSALTGGHLYYQCSYHQ